MSTLADETVYQARTSSLAFRYAFRELRGGLRGFVQDNLKYIAPVLNVLTAVGGPITAGIAFAVAGVRSRALVTRLRVLPLALYLGLIAFGLLGGYVAWRRDASVPEGLAMGAIFGPLGVLVALWIPLPVPLAWRRDAAIR